MSRLDPLDWNRVEDFYYRVERFDESLEVYIQRFSPVTRNELAKALRREGLRIEEVEIVEEARESRLDLFLTRWRVLR
jgi:predicted naringenin-chalcone synthase